MGFWAAIPVIGSVIEQVLGLVDQAVTDKDEANRIKQEITLRLAEMDFQEAQNELRAQASIILGEIQGESWLQRSWRPILMLSVVAIVVINYILYPYLSLLGLPATVLELPDELFELMSIGVGGYVLGRSVEKGIGAWKGGS